MITKYSVNDNISSNQLVILQSQKVIATLTIMIVTTTIIITIITTKIRAITAIQSVLILQKSVTYLFCTLNLLLLGNRQQYYPRSLSIKKSFSSFLSLF